MRPHFARTTWVALLPLALAAPAGAQRRWAAELALGTAWSLRTPLVVEQTGEPELRIDRANWETRPWRDSPYYAYRFGVHDGWRGAELELTHHKLYLRDPPPEIERFEVTHGYNLATGNFVAEVQPRWELRLGAGLVIAHAESRIRGRSRERDSRYEAAGPTVKLSVLRRTRLARALHAAVETKLTASRARVGVAGGTARVPNVAAHALVWLGVKGR